MSSDINADQEKWITENYNDIYKMSYKVKKRLYSKTSDFQKVEVYDTDYLGRVLLNDDLLMTSERDEFVYHEMISHVPLFSHPNPKKVLVIGGGDGGTVREVLKHKSVEGVVMVEIDSCVIEASKEYISVTAEELENTKLKLIIDDGVKYLKEAEDESFDVVLVDSTDPIGPAAPLFNESFYSDVKRVLTDEGIVVSQCENPFLEMETQKSLLSIKAKLFNGTFVYNYSNITYPSGLWSFSMACKGDLKPFSPIRTEEFLKDLKYYNKKIHEASFALPQFQKTALKETLTRYE
jgi:spermidine synthase